MGNETTMSAMKKFYSLFLLLLLIPVIAFMMIAPMLIPPPKQEVNMTAVNDIVRSLEKSADYLQALQHKTFLYDFIVLDASGTCIYQSSDGLPENQHEGIKRGFITADLNTEESRKVMIQVSPEKYYEKLFSHNAKIILLASILIMFLLFFYFLYLYRKILHPFGKLHTFAKQISNGQFNTPLPMDKHNMFGAFTESFDIMRECLLEARRNELAENQSKKELVASLSHDIKTPVTSLRLISELLQAQIINEEHLEKLRAIDTKTQQIDRLINNLLQSTLQELGHLKVTAATEDSRILHDLIKNFNICGNINMMSVLPCLIHIDVMRLEQVLGNIISNANKYARPPIAIEFTMADSFLQMDIKDYGPGVEETELEYLCTKFYRATKAQNSKKEGEGLGLYIAKLLMNKMDGDLECLNRKDGFTVRLLIALAK